MTRIYFAHPKVSFDTIEEYNALKWINRIFDGYDVINPKNYDCEDGQGQQYFKVMFGFYKMVDTCDLIVWFGNSDGVRKELMFGLEHEMFLIEVPKSIYSMEA